MEEVKHNKGDRTEFEERDAKVEKFKTPEKPEEIEQKIQKVDDGLAPTASSSFKRFDFIGKNSLVYDTIYFTYLRLKLEFQIKLNSQ